MKIGLTLLGTLGTLVTSYVGWRLQQGGRRRRLRREIREELELIDKLEPSPARERLEVRVRKLIEDYEPDLAAHSAPVMVFRRTALSTAIEVMTVIGVVGFGALIALNSPGWFSLVVGVLVGVVLIGTGITRGRAPTWEDAS